MLMEAKKISDEIKATEIGSVKAKKVACAFCNTVHWVNYEQTACPECGTDGLLQLVPGSDPDGDYVRKNMISRPKVVVLTASKLKEIFRLPNMINVSISEILGDRHYDDDEIMITVRVERKGE